MKKLPLPLHSRISREETILHLPPQGLSRAKDILPFLPFGRTTLHEWSKDGRFPASTKLSPTMVAWRNCEVLDWLSRVENNSNVVPQISHGGENEND